MSRSSCHLEGGLRVDAGVLKPLLLLQHVVQHRPELRQQLVLVVDARLVVPLPAHTHTHSKTAEAYGVEGGDAIVARVIDSHETL